MVRLKIVDEAQADTLYADLARGLGSINEMVIGNNTRLVRMADNSIAIRLYATDVVVVHPNNEVEYQTGGYLTRTTLSRINRVAHKFGIHAKLVHVGQRSRMMSLERINDDMCLSQGQDECVCNEGEQEFFVVEDTKLNKMLAEVAEAAYPHVVAAYQELFGEQGEEVLDEGFDLYLYVYGDGNWVIDRPDYLWDHRNIAATALVGPYESVDTLRYELEGSTY